MIKRVLRDLAWAAWYLSARNAERFDVGCSIDLVPNHLEQRGVGATASWSTLTHDIGHKGIRSGETSFGASLTASSVAPLLSLRIPVAGRFPMPPTFESEPASASVLVALMGSITADVF